MRPSVVRSTVHRGLVQRALVLPLVLASIPALVTAAPAAPSVTGSPLPLAAGAVLLGDSVLLTRGSTYRARLKLNFLQCFASRSKIVRKLQDRGFGGVRLFMSARELPVDWPPQFRPKAGQCERYAEGTWTRETRQQRRPSAIETLWLLRR